jgi:hypothetical protein
MHTNNETTHLKTQVNDSVKIRIIKSWRHTNTSRAVSFAIPFEIAQKYSIEHPVNLFVIPREDGILLRKVDTEGIK